MADNTFNFDLDAPAVLTLTLDPVEAPAAEEKHSNPLRPPRPNRSSSAPRSRRWWTPSLRRQAERAVTDMTNELLKKNADALKMGTIETAKESQRGVVDIETLQQTNKSLIETLDELNKIQSEGRAKRAAAEQELTRIEDELKQKMMEIRS